jgi:threonine dehydrogenase-like Zn-dependent dehydrogenase
MKALVYGVAPEPFEVRGGANTLTVNLARTPTALRQVPDPQLPHEDWVLTRPRLTGICGSDSKQILMDFGEGDADNDLVAAGRVDLRPMLTHTYPLDQWRDAFLAIANQGESGAIKVAIDQR